MITVSKQNFFNSLQNAYGKKISFCRTFSKTFSTLHREYGNKLLKFTIFEKNNRETFGPLDQRLIDTLRDNLSQWAIENVSNMLTVGTHGYDF